MRRNNIPSIHTSTSSPSIRAIDELRSDLYDHLAAFTSTLDQIAVLHDARLDALNAELNTLKRTPEYQPWKDRKEAAAYLSCSIAKIDDLASNGRLPKHKLDGKPLFHVDDLDALVQPVAIDIEDDEAA